MPRGGFEPLKPDKLGFHILVFSFCIVKKVFFNPSRFDVKENMITKSL